MARLAKLPIFLEIEGQRVVVAGGSKAASWKAELLAAAGGEVVVFSARPHPAMERLAGSPPVAGKVTLIRRDLCADDLAGTRIAIADQRDPAKAKAFAASARRTGALVNVIDNPAFCDFQFGAIVNRSPVVIGISTNGAAPILAQAIRRRIEALLPPGLAVWAAAAGRIRSRIAALWPDAGERRSFWERFVDLAFGRECPVDLDAALASLLEQTADAEGKSGVIFVGAGPGKADYLTLQAVRALQTADVIVHDAWIEPGVLDLARREALRVALGGSPHPKSSCSRDEENRLLIRLALENKRVVRLTPGDPMLFERAGEDVAMLEAAGVAVTVVPGISPAFAFAATLGVPLAHLDLAPSLRLVAGCGRDGRLPAGLDFCALADPATTLIVELSGQSAIMLKARLQDHGLPASTPVAIAVNFGRKDQVVWTGSLGAMSTDIAGLHTFNWVIIGIGQVFAVRQESEPLRDQADTGPVGAAKAG